MKTNNTDDSFFATPLDPQAEARALALEVLCRLFIWMAEAGLRATVALYCVRPDLIDHATLEQIGDRAGRTRQAVHKLADSFRHSTGFAS
ncbi:MAG: hypothetical protein ABIZ04_01710 [Opitutus sp.]